MHGVVDVRPKHVAMKISSGRPTLSAPVPLVFHPMGAASCQAQGFKCIHTGAHLPGARCIRTGSTFTGARRPPARLQVQTCRCPQARLQVHRCPQTWLRACRCTQVRLQVQPCRYPHARLQAQTCRCAIRMGSGSVYTYPPTSHTTQPMGSGHPGKASHSQCRPVPSAG